MQRVEIVYHYVYVKVPRHVSGGGGMAVSRFADSEEMRRLQKKLDKLQKTHKKDRAVDGIMDMCRKIMHLMRLIPSAGIQRMLGHAMAAAMHQLKSGDITGAANAVSDLLSLATKCKELCDDIMGNIMKLRHGGGVTGPAAQALFNMSFAAERALNHAGSLDTLMMIKDLTDEGVKIMNKLSSEKPGTKEYEALCGALANLTQDLVLLGQEDAMKQQAQDGTQGPGMDPDRNEIVGGIDALIDNAIRQLKRRKDPNDLRKAEQLGADLRGALKAGRDNGADLDGLGQEIQQLLSRALDGDLDAACRDSHQLCENEERITRLRPTLDVKLEHLEDAANELQGPAAKAMQQLKDALKHDCDHCTDPEAMIQLDSELAKCMELANKLAKLPPGEQLRSPEYRQLLIILRKRCQPSESPLGRDQYGPSKAQGTAPLQAPGTKRLEEDQWVIPSLDKLEKKKQPDELILTIEIEEKHRHHHHHHDKDPLAAGMEGPSPGKDLPSPGKDLPSPGKDLPSDEIALAGKKPPVAKQDLPSPEAAEIIEIDIRIEREGRHHHHHHHHADEKAPAAATSKPSPAASQPSPGADPIAAKQLDAKQVDASTAIGHELKRRQEQPDELLLIVTEQERLHRHRRHHHHKHPTAQVELPKEPAKLGRPAQMEALGRKKEKPKAEHCDPAIDAAVAAIAVVQQAKSANPGT